MPLVFVRNYRGQVLISQEQWQHKVLTGRKHRFDIGLVGFAKRHTTMSSVHEFLDQNPSLEDRRRSGVPQAVDPAPWSST